MKFTRIGFCFWMRTSNWIRLASHYLPGLMDQKPVMGYLTSIRNYVLSMRDRVWDRPAIPNNTSFEPAKKYPAYVEHENVRLFRRSSESSLWEGS